MAERYIPEHRRTQFKAKNTFKPEELRRRREEQQVEIRKAKREENLAKRRGIGTGDQRPGASLGAAPDSDDETVPTESQVCLGLSCPSPTSLHSLQTLVPPLVPLVSPASARFTGLSRKVIANVSQSRMSLGTAIEKLVVDFSRPAEELLHRRLILMLAYCTRFSCRPGARATR